MELKFQSRIRLELFRQSGNGFSDKSSDSLLTGKVKDFIPVRLGRQTTRSAPQGIPYKRKKYSALNTNSNMHAGKYARKDM